MAQSICDLYGKYKQGIIHFVKFNFVGIVNTGITFAIFTFLNKLFGVLPAVAHPIGYGIGLVNSFIMNKLWTFGKKQSFNIWEAVKFAIVNLTAFGGGEIFQILNSMNKWMDPVVAQFITLLFSMPCNYIGSKYWVFNDNARKHPHK